MSLDPVDKECSISHTFRHVYRFILEAMKGDKAAASAIFQKCLVGELPEELISLSRYVQQNHNRSLGDNKRRGPARERQRKGTHAAADDTLR
jgi:hypothetical protein